MGRYEDPLRWGDDTALNGLSFRYKVAETPSPTKNPTKDPTAAPTKDPTASPIKATSAPTKDPTAAPTKDPTASPIKATGWMCTGSKVNLGTKYGDAGQCLAASQKDPRCTGIAVMTSPSYPSWGCRCCLAGAKYTPNMHWNIFRNEKPSSTSPATKQPTTAPTAKPKASPAKKPTGYVCTGNKVNLGTKYNGVGLCAAAARKDPRCTGIATMMAKQHPSWGCRCCLAGARYQPYPDKTWSIYQDGAALYKSGYICTQKKNLGQSYPTSTYCLVAALKDPTCGNSVMYNKSLGCRCCVKGTKYTPNMHWNIWRNEKQLHSEITQSVTE